MANGDLIELEKKAFEFRRQSVWNHDFNLQEWWFVVVVRLSFHSTHHSPLESQVAYLAHSLSYCDLHACHLVGLLPWGAVEVEAAMCGVLRNKVVVGCVWCSNSRHWRTVTASECAATKGAAECAA